LAGVFLVAACDHWLETVSDAVGIMLSPYNRFQSQEWLTPYLNTFLCSHILEVLHLIAYPLIMSGTNHGLQRPLPEYVNKELLLEKIDKLTSPT